MPKRTRSRDDWAIPGFCSSPWWTRASRPSSAATTNAARSFWQEGLITTRASGDQASEAILLLSLGRLDIFEANYATGRPPCEQGLAMARQIGDTWIIWGALHALALAALAQGDLATARALSYESLSLPASPNMRLGMQIVRGLVALEGGEHTAAREHLTEALALAVSSADPLATAQVVEYVAHLASDVGQSDVALRLAAAAEAARETLNVVISRSIETFPHLSHQPRPARSLVDSTEEDSWR